MKTLRDTTTDRIRELRLSRGMTQQDLSDRLNQIGAHLDRTAVAKVETGTRELSLMEAFMYAWALHVAPVHLFVPTDTDEPIHLGPNMEASPSEVRAWIRGQHPLFQEPRAYFSTVPPAEFTAGTDEGGKS